MIAQNKCLRTITNAFKTVSIPIFKKKTHVMPILFYINQLSALTKVRQRNANIKKIIKTAYTRIKNRLQFIKDQQAAAPLTL